MTIVIDMSKSELGPEVVHLIGLVGIIGETMVDTATKRETDIVDTLIQTNRIHMGMMARAVEVPETNL